MPAPFLLFDLDGTLSDPQVGITRSINHALVAHGRQPHDESALCRFIGPPLDVTFRALVPDADARTLEALIAAYRERYGDVGYAENVLYAGVPDALTRLDAAGAVLAVCTSKRADFAELILEMFGLRHLFTLVSGGDIGIPKWRQLGDLLASSRVPGHAVMIGDRAFDMVAAHRNGLRAGAVTWGHGERDELAAEAPEFWFDRPEEWLRLVRRPSGVDGDTPGGIL